MSAESLKNLAVNQLKALSAMAKQEGHAELGQQFDLFSASLNVDASPVFERPVVDHIEYEEDAEYDEEYEEDDVPDGFNSHEDYENFVRQQGATRIVEDDETGEEYEVIPDSVHGVIQDENGEYKEAGDFEADLEQAQELLEESNTIRDEETGDVLFQNEPDEVPTVEIVFSRTDGNELTAEDVEGRILSHPQSEPMLRAFGEDYTVNEGNGSQNKVVAFSIDQGNSSSRSTAQLLSDRKFMSFGGKIIVPGLGQVSARPVFD